MTTNITKEHRAAFEALISADYDNFALFSCFVDGEPAAAIVAVNRDGEVRRLRRDRHLCRYLGSLMP